MGKNNRWISGPLMREGLKQFWFIPVMIFIAYFMSGIFPLILAGLGTYGGNFAREALQNDNLGFLFNIGGASIILGCMATRMWHGQAQAFSIVSQPYSRSKIFNTNVLLGWLMMIVPVLLMAVIYIAISPIVKVAPVPEDMLITGPVLQDMAMIPAYGLMEVLKWIIDTTAIFTFLYALSVMAGVFSGTTLMTVLLSLFNMGIVTAVVGTGILYAEELLRGFFTVGEMPIRIMSMSNPIVGKIFTEAQVLHPVFGTVVRSLMYMLAAIILLYLAGQAFKRAKLERSGDHMMSRRGEALVTAILTFEGAALLGIIMAMAFESKAALAVGFVLGAVLTWFIVKVILVRSVKIFNKENVMPLIAGTVGAALLVLVMVTDIFGYGLMVPDKEDIKGINPSMLVNYNSISVYDEGGRFLKADQPIEDEEFISKVVELHEYIVENRLMQDKDDGQFDLVFRYEMKDGREMERQLFLDENDEVIEMLQALSDSAAYKDCFTIPKDFIEYAKRAEITYNSYTNVPSGGQYDFYLNIQDKETLQAIIQAYNNCVMEREMSVRSWIRGGEPEPERVCWIDLGIAYDNGAKGEGFLSMNIRAEDTELEELMLNLYNEQK